MKPLPFTDPELISSIEHSKSLRTCSDGTILMNPGDKISFIPIVLRGSIRVLLQNPEGDERYLYHILPGETCAMSLTCCQRQNISEIKAIIEEETDLLMLPVSKLDEWTKFPEWKKYIGDTQAQRFSELLETIDNIAFNHLDEQLWNYLIKRVQATGINTIKITHLEISKELHSPREVITRLLHQLRIQKKVTLGRGTIEVHISM